MTSRWWTPAAVAALLTLGGPSDAEDFSGGGGSIFLGTGSPNSVDAASALAGDLDVNDEAGNFLLGIAGFYQGDRFRLGGAFQAQAWGGVNPGDYDAEDDAAGVAAATWGLYGTYTFRHDRVLLNAGGVAGAGRCFLGYTLGDGTDADESVATFYLEPHVCVGVAATSWFGVEFQLSTPIYLLTDDLELTVANRTYRVEGSDLAGLDFSLRLTFGRIAAL
jgi:hypothetical protein